MILDILSVCILALGGLALWSLPWTDGEIEQTDRQARELARETLRRLRRRP
jgi:hypothetical protein